MENLSGTQTYIIGISGGSGSGKTTFVNSLKQRLSEKSITILSMDNYYFPREQQFTDDQGYKNFDLMSSIDVDTFKKDLDQLVAGNQVKRIEYVYNNEEAIPSELIIHPAPIILVEGLFIFSDPQLSDKINLKIIINAKDVIKVIRRIHRDKVERNYPVEDVIYRYQHHVLPSYEEHIAPFLQTVDLVINNNENYDEALDMVSMFIKEKAGNANS